MSEKKTEEKTIEVLKKDLKKAQQSLEMAVRQEVMLQGVVSYLNQKIAELTPKPDKEGGK